MGLSRLYGHISSCATIRSIKTNRPVLTNMFVKKNIFWSLTIHVLHVNRQQAHSIINLLEIVSENFFMMSFILIRRVILLSVINFQNSSLIIHSCPVLLNSEYTNNCIFSVRIIILTHHLSVLRRSHSYIIFIFMHRQSFFFFFSGSGKNKMVNRLLSALFVHILVYS